MKKYSKEELNQIKNNLKAGVIYTGVKNNNSTGYIHLEGNKIKYNNYGSSYCKNTLKDLNWLLNNIFNDCELITKSIYSEYHVNYKPVNEKYNCLDLSSSHPNVYGL